MKTKNLFWGLFFILAAVLIVLDNVTVDGLKFGVTQSLITICLVVVMMKSIPHCFWPGILYPLGVLYLICSRYIYILSLNPLSVWQVLLIATLGCIGLSFLFPSGKHRHGNHRNFPMKSAQDDVLEGEQVYVRNSFGETTRYIKSTNLESANLENQFGELQVYFDEVKRNETSVEICVNNSFGEMILYIPKEWKVENRIGKTLASVAECGTPGKEGSIVTLTGSVSFGEVRIIYI